MNLAAEKYDELRYETGCYYTTERNKQIVLYLLKKYGISKVVVSPGATNYALVGSMQHDSFFQMYSCVDERAAAYMAIGMAEKSKEPVILSCTGATASRNYMAALTYAFKYSVPILVITSSLSLASVGNLKAQVTDREHPPVDMVLKSYQFDNIKNGEDEWKVSVKSNEALTLLLEKKKPILINVCTTYQGSFNVKELPPAKYIPTYTCESVFPSLPDNKICIFIGSHKKFTNELTMALDSFCESHDAVVMCDHTSGYNGRFKVNMTLPFCQEQYVSKNREVDLLIHIGEISGDYYTFCGIMPKQVWRVNPDGAYSDFFKKLTAVFKLNEIDFFNHYNSSTLNRAYYDACLKESIEFKKIRPEVPFSNIWIANQLHDKLPKGSQIHFGILNTLRSWDFFDLPEGIESKSNVGGFGIDGCVSTMIGAAMMAPDKLFFCIVGDLAFYYDVNILLNKQLPKNFRLIVVNNGRGIEFRNYCHPAFKSFGKSVDSFVAAAGHYSKCEEGPISDLCRESNIDYYCISSKEGFGNVLQKLTEPQSDKSLIIEAITTPEDESNALRLYLNCKKRPNKFTRKIKNKLRALINKLINN